MTPEQIADHYWAAESSLDAAATAAWFLDDAVFIGGPQLLVGIEAIRAKFVPYLGALRRLEVETGTRVIAGARAAIAWDAVFTPVDGEPYALAGLNLFHTEDDRIAKLECFYDERPLTLDFLRRRAEIRASRPT
jgi:hypothetical protein